MWRPSRTWRPQRKDVLFVIGLVGLAIEQSRYFGEPSAALLIIFAGFMGLPIMLRIDESKPPSSAPTRKEGES